MSETKDFFISYNRADKQWAEWIAWILEEAGYSVLIQAWDFRPGGNFVLDMQRAAAESKKTIAVLSESYLKSSFTQPEWAAAFVQDPQSLDRKLLPVRVKECQPEGILRAIVYVDLVGLSETEAKQALLGALVQRAKPETQPIFPDSTASPDSTAKLEPASAASFPTAASRVQQIKAKGLQTQLENLTADYEALNQQLSNTIDAVERTRRERQLDALAQEMEKVAEKLDVLGG
ncbi:TIR domain-containing protein [Leptolyngbya sp. GGD]|uniref:TIR domain-containing protein n=1 Tax=Leptolyngbya sp. GGD TaxID=2997907 RepID=UPI00227A9D2D|nr:TIR domain-containing protein [Leptolyngbya sp. GGD]MCY6489395.1 TIR domain-containing protein [Leptolyngbya sp. GGD]